MQLTQVTFTGPPLDDPDMLKQAPVELRHLLQQLNGFILFGGGLHVRGACHKPLWHSLRWAWEGKDALHRRYASVVESDIPFAQDCVGDQFLLRKQKVIRLYAETGEIDDVGVDLLQFLEAAQSDPVSFLGQEPLLQFRDEGGDLQPGQLLGVMPPFCIAESGKGVSLRAIPVLDRLAFLADFSRQIADVPEGGKIQIEIKSS